jgi:hypothetical protein
MTFSEAHIRTVWTWMIQVAFVLSVTAPCSAFAVAVGSAHKTCRFPIFHYGNWENGYPDVPGGELELDLDCAATARSDWVSVFLNDVGVAYGFDGNLTPDADDGTVSIWANGYPGEEIAGTVVDDAGNIIRNVQIVLNRRDYEFHVSSATIAPTSTRIDARTVYRHELGHALGLAPQNLHSGTGYSREQEVHEGIPDRRAGYRDPGPTACSSAQ